MKHIQVVVTIAVLTIVRAVGHRARQAEVTAAAISQLVRLATAAVRRIQQVLANRQVGAQLKAGQPVAITFKLERQ